MWNPILYFLLSFPVAAFLPTVSRQAQMQRASTTAQAKRNANNNDTNQRPDITHFPKLIVLDLDNTLWTPELYQLRRRRSFAGRNNDRIPQAHHDVQLFPGAADLIDTIRSGNYFPSSTKFAVASRTQTVDWAHDLLTQFGLREVLDFVEIFPGHKRQHFGNLRRDSGCDYKQMLFLDDARDGKYGNCVPVASELGVLSAHCPNGLDDSNIWQRALQVYDQRQRDQAQGPAVVEWDGTVTELSGSTTTTNARQTGRIKTVNVDRGFGFIQSNNGDVFFHFSKLPPGVQVEQGDTLSYLRVQDSRTGKWRADDICIESNTAAGDAATTTSSSKDTVSLHAFSMNIPFAALLANGYKTLESRNGTMFVPYKAGTQMLLHVGRRTYPDGDKHLDILRNAGLSDEKIAQLKSLPHGFGKGALVAIVELGDTYDTTVAERSTPQMQQRICAYGTDSGRRVTEIRRVRYLKRPVPTPAQGGVWKVELDPALLPDDWTTTTTMPQAYRVKDDDTQKESGSKRSNAKVVYTISG